MDALIQPIVKPLGNLYAKAPALPAGGRDFLVTIAPWLSLVFGVLTVIGSLSAFGVGAVYSPFYAMAGVSPVFLMIIGVVGLIQGAIMVLAFAPLRKRSLRGWNLLFLSEIVAIVSSVISINVGSIVMAVVFAAIAFYLLFQVKPSYT
ncbi:MAG: hypothetical protein AAB520_03665 [Patescibacteria group bacterium]